MKMKSNGKVKVVNLEKCKVWEKNRRNKLNDKLFLLSSLLPSYDPSKKMSKLEILDKSVIFIKELRLSNSRLVSAKSRDEEKSKMIRNLQDEVNKLVLRLKQLTKLLEDSKIVIPIGPNINIPEDGDGSKKGKLSSVENNGKVQNNETNSNAIIANTTSASATDINTGLPLKEKEINNTTSFYTIANTQQTIPLTFSIAGQNSSTTLPLQTFFIAPCSFSTKPAATASILFPPSSAVQQQSTITLEKEPKRDKCPIPILKNNRFKKPPPVKKTRNKKPKSTTGQIVSEKFTNVKNQIKKKSKPKKTDHIIDLEASDKDKGKAALAPEINKPEKGKIEKEKQKNSPTFENNLNSKNKSSVENEIQNLTETDQIIYETSSSDPKNDSENNEVQLQIVESSANNDVNNFADIIIIEESITKSNEIEDNDKDKGNSQQDIQILKENVENDKIPEVLEKSNEMRLGIGKSLDGSQSVSIDITEKEQVKENVEKDENQPMEIEISIEKDKGNEEIEKTKLAESEPLKEKEIPHHEIETCEKNKNSLKDNINNSSSNISATEMEENLNSTSQMSDQISACIARSIDIIDHPEIMELGGEWTGQNQNDSPKSISPTQMFLSMFPLLPRDSIVPVTESQNSPQPQSPPKNSTTNFTSIGKSSSFYIDSMMLPDENSSSNINNNNSNNDQPSEQDNNRNSIFTPAISSSILNSNSTTFSSTPTISNSYSSFCDLVTVTSSSALEKSNNPSRTLAQKDNTYHQKSKNSQEQQNNTLRNQPNVSLGEASNNRYEENYTLFSTQLTTNPNQSFNDQTSLNSNNNRKAPSSNQNGNIPNPSQSLKDFSTQPQQYFNIFSNSTSSTNSKFTANTIDKNNIIQPVQNYQQSTTNNNNSNQQNRFNYQPSTSSTQGHEPIQQYQPNLNLFQSQSNSNIQEKVRTENSNNEYLNFSSSTRINQYNLTESEVIPPFSSNFPFQPQNFVENDKYTSFQKNPFPPDTNNSNQQQKKQHNQSSQNKYPAATTTTTTATQENLQASASSRHQKQSRQKGHSKHQTNNKQAKISHTISSISSTPRPSTTLIDLPQYTVDLPSQLSVQPNLISTSNRKDNSRSNLQSNNYFEQQQQISRKNLPQQQQNNQQKSSRSSHSFYLPENSNYDIPSTPSVPLPINSTRSVPYPPNNPQNQYQYQTQKTQITIHDSPRNANLPQLQHTSNATNANSNIPYTTFFPDSNSSSQNNSNQHLHHQQQHQQQNLNQIQASMPLYPNFMPNSDNSTILQSQHQQHQPQAVPVVASSSAKRQNRNSQNSQIHPVNWMTDQSPYSRKSISNPFPVSKLVNVNNNNSNSSNRGNQIQTIQQHQHNISTSNSNNNNNYYAEALLRKIPPNPTPSVSAEQQWRNNTTMSQQNQQQHQQHHVQQPPNPFILPQNHSRGTAESQYPNFNQNQNNVNIHQSQSQSNNNFIQNPNNQNYEQQQQQNQATSSVSNFNLSSIFPEINDKRGGSRGGGNGNNCNYYD